MDGLHRGGNLGVRGREEARDLLGQGLVGGEAGELALPEVEIAPGQPVEIGRLFVVFRGHAATIAYRGADAAFAGAKPFLSHCGIGANVTARRKRAFTAREPEERRVMAEQAVADGGPKPAPVVIKKYANRRLYNTST